MPQDRNLYGQPPPKKQKKEMALSGSLAFTSQLSSLLADPPARTAASSSSNTATTGRTRPSKLKTDDLSKTKVKRKDKPTTEPKDDRKLSLKSPLGTEDSKAEREFARRKMESKARLYAAMQRGDYIGREIGLVDFDRKWAESQSNKPTTTTSSASSSDSEPDDDAANDSNIDTTLHEHTDEFGRVRHLTRSQILRLQRGAASATELENMSARPRAPDTLIYGDAVQAEAFAARDGAETMEALARKRDRSATPPEATHYQADWEIRTKGVGFYKFSREEGRREEEMKALGEERARTEGLRREREEKARRRKEEIEARRREILERRTKKMADSFLEGLEKDLVGG
ncbi:hypothetical protein C8A01DRAFT_32795 [Parachaetomium inaequale]|uniref:Uncharacterized protein n=1 Tax=Parachaetomium inaequale TaxID=2588326 RepID=A0AAN6PNK5_9PEZI|nr:hypothetical protein C8A01DRAFT_32795 [Parachaetomium inaequale]